MNKLASEEVNAKLLLGQVPLIRLSRTTRIFPALGIHCIRKLEDYDRLSIEIRSQKMKVELPDMNRQWFQLRLRRRLSSKHGW